MSSSIQTYEFRRTEPVSTPVGRVPRVTRLLALAHKIDGLIRSVEVRNWAEAARLVGVTRARMTQIAKLLLLAPQIQESILDLSNVIRGPDPVTERALRAAAAQVDWQRQEMHLPVLPERAKLRDGGKGHVDLFASRDFRIHARMRPRGSSGLEKPCGDA